MSGLPPGILKFFCCIVRKVALIEKNLFLNRFKVLSVTSRKDRHGKFFIFYTPPYGIIAPIIE